MSGLSLQENDTGSDDEHERAEQLRARKYADPTIFPAQRIDALMVLRLTRGPHFMHRCMIESCT
jgi:hypothetical protein